MPAPSRALAIAVAVLSTSPLFADPPKPVGTWTRRVAARTVTVAFTETTLTVRCAFGDDVAEVVTVDAEYSITSDGVLYGVIVGADARPDGLVADGKLELAVGQPFAARYWVDGGVMHVRDVKVLGSGLGRDDAKSGVGDLVKAVTGRYEADGVPAAVRAERERPGTAGAPALVAPRTLPPPAPVAAPPAYIVEQWEKDTGVRPAAGREVAPAPRPCGTH